MIKKISVTVLITLIIFSCNKNDKISEKTNEPIEPIAIEEVYKSPPVYSENNDNEIKQIAFEREGEIFVKNLLTGDTKSFGKGQAPALSPDGSIIALPKLLNDNWGVSFIDLVSRNETFVEISKEFIFDLVWSPDGKKMAFTMNDYGGKLILLNINSQKFIKINKFEPSFVYAPTWDSSSELIYAHDLSKLYTFNIEGDLISETIIDDFIEQEYSYSNMSRFYFISPDYLVFDGGLLDETIPGLYEPPNAIFIKNINTNTITRLTPKGFQTVRIVLSEKSAIYCSGYTDINESMNIYSITPGEKNIQLIIEDARAPSISY